jgi:3-phenylpropionate/trans-cinnamate dioxygenase ferredoxin reductase component
MHYVLIGGGLASATAAEHIRKRDAGGEITIVGAEPHLPYLRPPLSKEYLRGDAEVKDTLIYREEWYRDQTIRVRQGRRRPPSTRAPSASRSPAARH